MNIVFIAHFFPPMNSTGARRVTAFASNLAAMGHTVTVVTSQKTAAHGPFTESVPAKVTLIELPRSTDTASPGSATERRGSYIDGRSRARRVRRTLGRLMIACSGQIIDRQLLFAWRVVQSSDVERIVAKADAVVSTSPPWVTHLAAARLHRRTGTPWVADYRDPFSGSHLNTGSLLSRQVERWIDRRLARTAQAITTVSPALVQQYSKWNAGTHLIYNGYDQDLVDALMTETAADEPAEPRQLTIRYVGSYRPGNPPTSLLRALASLPDNVPWRLEVVGDNSSAFVAEAVALHSSLNRRIRALPRVDHENALRMMRDADCLLLIESWAPNARNDTVVATTKVFEHMAFGRPTLAVTSPSIAAVPLLAQSGLLLCASRDPEEIRAAILRLHANPKSIEPKWSSIRCHSRQQQATQLESVIASIGTSA